MMATIKRYEPPSCLSLFAILLASCGGGGGGAAAVSSNIYWSVAVGDLNGDGLPDIVASYSILDTHAGYVAVYLQDPTKPGTLLPAATYSVGEDPVYVAIGDLNGDGKPDVVTANALLGGGGDTVSLLLQDPAEAGHLLAAATLSTGPNPQSIAIADVNGDGSADLVVADGLGISLLFQEPSAPGIFLPRQTISVGSGASFVSVADLNGDGMPDFAVTNGYDILVYLQQAGAAGTFLLAGTYAAGTAPISTALADLNGDGALDIAVADLGTDTATGAVSVLLQEPSSPGSFPTAVSYKTGDRTTVVAIADLNGDGKADLVAGNLGSLACSNLLSCHAGVISSLEILLQDPNVPGQFLGATNYAAGGVSGLAIADMNGDGKPDIVSAESNGVFIRFQDPSKPGRFLTATRVSQ